MKRLFSILLFLFSRLTLAQVDLAIQKGHSDQIIRMEFSKSGTYLASQGENNEILLWETNHQKVLSSFEIDSRQKINGLRFSDDESVLNVRTSYRTYSFDIISSELRDELNDSDTLYRKKYYFLDTITNYETWIEEGAIKKKRRDKKWKKYKVAVTYLNSPFNAFDVSLNKNLLVGVAADELIYVYNYKTGKKLKVLKGHNSEINEVRFTPDGKYFATAGRDRSIIIWRTADFEMYARFYSNVFQKKTVVFSEDGLRIYAGDELGYIYEIDLGAVFPKVNVTRPNFHSVNKIFSVKRADLDGYYVATSNNSVYFKENLASNKPLAKYRLLEHRVKRSKRIVLQKMFNVYQEPFGEVTALDISPNGSHLVFTGKCDNPNIALYSLNKKRSRHLYHTEGWEQWTDVQFTSDSTFTATLDSSNILFNWKIRGKHQNRIFLQRDTLPFNIINFEYIGSNQLWLNSDRNGQFVYNLDTRAYSKKLIKDADNVFCRENYIFVGLTDYEILVYDLIQDKTVCTLKGHGDKLSDVNFHPNGDLIITSSEDGTLKMWSLKKKDLIVTIIPFKNQEFVFVLKDNSYLISKGAMTEIGFKYKGEYFFPDQFDLKFNRPDKVLSELGFTDSTLILAYHKAYLKRLKKMNFTEEELNGEFHLPKVDISNISEIPPATSSNELKIKLKAWDDKYFLDRVNIWINEVKVREIYLRKENSCHFEEEISVELAFGKNKLEINALNEKGTESYKKTIVVNSTAGKKKPDLYIATIGVSEYLDNSFNLNYAVKDAIDVTGTFRLNPFFENIYSETLTNEEVTKENVANLKPFIEQADINDVVMIFVAGHGVLDENFDYFFASHDIDFQNPAERGIPYEAIEELVDKIRALRKLLFLDTCHSGELDKEDIEIDSMVFEENESELIFRSVGSNVKYKENPLGLKSTNELMKSLFLDLRRGTGATVISSSGGVELAMEGEEYQNGLFTFCMIKGLIEKRADLNKDKKIMVSELQNYIRNEVYKLSKGRQTPTSRVQNNELDYRIW